MVAPDSSAGRPHGSSSPPPTSTPLPASAEQAQAAAGEQGPSAPAPAAVMEPSQPVAQPAGVHPGVPGSLDNAQRPEGAAPGPPLLPPPAAGGEGAPRIALHRRPSNTRAWLQPHIFSSNDGDGDAQGPLAGTAHGAISAVLGRGLFTNVIPPGSRAGTVYFISIHDEEGQGKASSEAMRRLRTVPLSEIPADERECTICYEPLEEVPAEAAQATTAAAMATAVDSAHAGEQTPFQEEESLAAKDGHAPLQLPCKHVFGASCLRNWLQNSSTCPLCRVSIEPHPLRNRRHIVQRQEDLDRLWETIMRPYNEHMQRLRPNDQAGVRDASAANPNEPAGGEPNPNAESQQEQRPPYSIDFGEIVNALNIHAEHHRQQRDRRESEQRQGQQDQQRPLSNPEGGSPAAPRGDAGQQDVNTQSERQRETGPITPGPPPHHMHFHFNLDDALRENWPQTADMPPQEFIFDIRILPQPNTFFLGTDDTDRPGGAPAAAGTTGFETLRARQREEMLRAVQAAAEASLRNNSDADATATATAPLNSVDADVFDDPERDLFNNDEADASTGAAASQDADTAAAANDDYPPMIHFNPTFLPFDGSDYEDAERRREERTLRRRRERRRRQSQSQHAGVEAGAALPQSASRPDAVSAEASSSQGAPGALPRTPSTSSLSSTSSLLSARITSAGEADRQRRSGPNMGDAFIDEGLFQAFRRHFDAPDGQHNVLVEHLNERLPLPESRHDSMIVDSDTSRSATPSADAPAVDQNDDADISRSGPTRRAGRRRHPYPRS